tara:strand:- start:1469 stop:2134 length:666 start_codon:yes stop_codon:yes gene_type:complete
MAKELPYFKFEPNQWENGNIQICSREDKGLYLDLCSMYWSRLGDVPFKLAVQKLCGGNASAFDSLVNEDIFVVIDDMICIHFLNEQLEEFKDTSKTNQKNALEGWAKRRETKALKNNKSEKNATASKPQSETNAIREEKRRGEEIKEDKKEIFNSWLLYRKEIKKEIKASSTIDSLIKKFNAETLIKCKSVVNASIENNYQGLFWDNHKGNKINKPSKITF